MEIVCKVLDIEKILEILSLFEFGILKLKERYLYTQHHAPNSLSRLSPQRKLIQSPARIIHKLARTAWDFTTQGIWRQVPTHIQGECILVSPAPHPLLLSIWRLHSLAHHVVVPQLAKTLSSSTPCSSSCSHSTLNHWRLLLFKAKPKTGPPEEPCTTSDWQVIWRA